MYVDLEPEYMGIFGMSKEEKLLKVLKPTFSNLTVNTVSNLFKVYKDTAKKLNYLPSNDTEKKTFVAMMYKISSINTNIIAVFLDRLKEAIENGQVNVKDVSPELNKSKWQQYALPIIGLLAIGGIAYISTNYRAIKQLTFKKKAD